jgi:hypothetical protein
MNARKLSVIALLTLVLAPLTGAANAVTSDPASALYASLSDAQKKEATLPYDSPERNKEVFPGGKRPGIQLRTLSDEQQKLALEMLTRFTSDYGKQKVMAVADQKADNGTDPTGFGRYFLCYFGEPGEGKTYAWRLAEHHMTIVHVEVEKGQPSNFGPILLGANPPTLWDTEEEKLIALYQAMSDAERQQCSNGGKGISGAKFEGNGIKVAQLGPTAKSAAQAMLDQRLSFFSDDIRQRINKILTTQGGIDAMTIAFYGTPDKKCRDGGRWDFKLSGPSFLCDYEGTRGHIHLSMKGKLLEVDHR